jgi:hypothetical protein
MMNNNGNVPNEALSRGPQDEDALGFNRQDLDIFVFIGLSFFLSFS